MKKLALLALIPTFILGLAACDNSKAETHKYNENFLYTEPTYEPLDLSSPRGAMLVNIELVGNYGGVKVADWDNRDIKLRCSYYKETYIKDVPFKVKNIPIEKRHILGEVGEHHLYMSFFEYDLDLKFDIIENPDFKGYQCEFYDMDKKYLTTQTVGYYQSVEYQGPVIPTDEEDFDNKYVFSDWTHSTQYVHQDMQYCARYKTTEKRMYGDRMVNWDYKYCSGLLESSRKRGSVLIYLGRVRHATAVHGESIYHSGNKETQVSLPVEALNGWNQYWGEMMQETLDNSVEYVPDAAYDSKIYGNPGNIIKHPNFATEFDSRYQYDAKQMVYLEDEGDVQLSNRTPYESLLIDIRHFCRDDQIKTIEKNMMPGYYRCSVVTSFDVYVSVSYNKIENHTYEISDFNQFIFAPIYNHIKFHIQYSEDGTFGCNFVSKLRITPKGLYNCAEALDWGTWED